MIARMTYDFVVLAHQPNTIRQYKIYTSAVQALARIMPFAWRDPIPVPVGGHYGVTRSLVSGLQKLGVRFAYAPRLERTTARAAVVLGGVEDLRAAMAWRRSGSCGLLLAGPNVVEIPTDQGGILLSPDIDRVIVASDKVRRQYESLTPQLVGRIWVWPAGVDENYWHSTSVGQRNTVLIYNKRMAELATQLSSVLAKNGFQCEVINYGDHRKDRYRLHQLRSALDRANACVMLTLDEPQGIVAAEVWSMNVPTLAYRAPGYETVETLPYLSPDTGSYWSSIEELVTLLKTLPRAAYRPRSWVLANMTDAICAAKLVALVNDSHVRHSTFPHEMHGP
jgi:hypothetical protein